PPSFFLFLSLSLRLSLSLSLSPSPSFSIFLSLYLHLSSSPSPSLSLSLSLSLWFSLSLSHSEPKWNLIFSSPSGRSNTLISSKWFLAFWGLCLSRKPLLLSCSKGVICFDFLCVCAVPVYPPGLLFQHPAALPLCRGAVCVCVCVCVCNCVCVSANEYAVGRVSLVAVFCGVV